MQWWSGIYIKFANPIPRTNSPSKELTSKNFAKYLMFLLPTQLLSK